MSDAGLELKCIQEALDTNRVVDLGSNVKGFEADLEALCRQNKRVFALSSGIAEVHRALINCGVKAGDEVAFHVSHSELQRQEDDHHQRRRCLGGSQRR